MGGLEDVSREFERGYFYSSFLGSVVKYLKDSSPENYVEVENFAKDTDSVRGGYFTLGHTNLSGGLKDRFDKLRGGDKVSWAKLLFQLEELYSRGYNLFPAAKEISPFKDRSLFFVDYGIGFSNMGHKGADIHRIIENKGFTIFDCDKYLVSFPINEGEVEVLELSRLRDTVKSL